MPEPGDRTAKRRRGSTTPPDRARWFIAPLTKALVAIMVFVAATTPPTVQAADCTVTSTGLVPLSEVGDEGYKGQPGGLYPDGANEPPAQHRAVALASAARVVPRGADGAPAPGPEGRVVLLSVGMSNTTQEFSTFVRDARRPGPPVGPIPVGGWPDPARRWPDLGVRGLAR